MNETANKHDDNGIGGYMYRKVTTKIAALLRQERLERGLSCEEVGEYFKISGQRLRFAELGGRRISWTMLGKLLKYYHKRVILSLDDLDEDGRNLVLLRDEVPPREE